VDERRMSEMSGMKGVSEKVVVVKREDVELSKNEMLSKSERMRRLYEKGYSVGDIGRLMGVRYNFVNNVVKGGGSGVSKNFRIVVEE
jgi:hypothetical protein